MQVHNSYKTLPKFKNAIVTIGTFDGVHYGHRQIINELISTAKKNQGESIVITFEPHPRLVVHPEQDPVGILSTLQEKIAIMSTLGIDHLVVVPFTPEFMNLSAHEYIEEFLIKSFQPHTIIIGYDHKFGKGRSGDINLLQEYAAVNKFQVLEISAQLVQEITISSTKIRSALINGHLEAANLFLQNPYMISGTVIHGDQRGRTIGFPTANILVHNRYKLLPKNGVYAIKAIFQGLEFNGILNIGTRPTVKDAAPVSIEAHLFNFSQEIYDEYITISLISRLRDEMKFSSIEELKAAIQLDVENAKKLLNHT